MPSLACLIPESQRTTLFSEADWTRLQSLGEVRTNPTDRKLTMEEAVALLEDCTVGISSWGTLNPGVPGLLTACPQLRLWEHAAGSVKGMFSPEIDRSNIVIASCAPAIADSVAEMTLGVLIDGLRKIRRNADANRQEVALPPAQRKCLHESVIGVIGASQVGRKVIPLLRMMGAEVLVYDPCLPAEMAAELGVGKEDDLERLCRVCDAVTLHTPALPSTTRMLTTRHFQAMREGTILVNLSRGVCIDQEALVEELRRDRITAYLDVSDPEPLPLDHPLRSLPNAHYTSHIGGNPSTRIGQQAVNDIARFLQGESPEMVVTESMLGHLA